MKKLGVLVLVMFSLTNNSMTFAMPEFWKTSAYAIECTQTPVKDVLEDFSRNFGVSLVVTGALSGRCDSWTRSDSAEKFLDMLGHKHQFQWFVYKGSLYVSSHNDSKTKRLEASAEFKDALIGLGLYQKKFGWGELTDEEVVLITGPSRYVNFISQLTNQESEAKRRNVNGDVHIFKLKYAPVADRTITIRDKDVVIPGISTILKNLLEDKKSIDRLESNGEDSESKPSRKTSRVYVESDVRTNSILIRAPEKDYDFYKNIISDLDVDSHLVEIDAIIVDINREKLKEVGANFSFTDKNDRFSINTATSGFDSGSLGAALNANATILIDDLGQFYSSLKALESEGDASIVANTSILTLDNQPAVIDLSETVYIRSVGERVIDVQPVTAGTLLNVIPNTVDTPEGAKIKLQVDIEDGKLFQAGDNDDTPSVQRTTISTKAIIDQNRSLVIGGYHVQTHSTDNSGIPLLKDVPILGKLFSSNFEQSTHLERLFILTPRISPTYHNPEDYSSTGNSDLIAKAVESVRARWADASRSYVEKTERLLTALASKKIPRGYQFGYTDNKHLGFTCSQNAIEYSFDDGQQVVGKGLTAYIGLVTNTSSVPIVVNESACRGAGLIGVSLFPDVALEPGARAEIFVSLESARMDVNYRQRLVDNLDDK